MNETLSMPDPTVQVEEIRHIIEHRGHHTCEATLLRIRRVVFPPPGDAPPVEFDDRGWPELRSNEERHDPGSGGTAWERHDDPHGDDPDTRY